MKLSKLSQGLAMYTEAKSLPAVSNTLSSPQPNPNRPTLAIQLRETRGLDLTLALAIALLLLVPGVLRALVAWVSTGRVFDRRRCIGRTGHGFAQLRFAGSTAGRNLALLINIVRGDLSFVGPPATELNDANNLRRLAELHLEPRPGLYAPQALREAMGIAHVGDGTTESNAITSMGVRQRLGLVVRSAIVRFIKGDGDFAEPPSFRLLGVDIVNTRVDEALDWIVDRVRSATPSLVTFVNPHCLNIASRDSAYRAVLNRSARVLPDGVGIRLGCRLKRVGLKANLNGTDLFPALCERAVNEGLSIYLLGARPGIAKAVAENMQARFPGLTIAGTCHGYFDRADEPTVIEAINRSRADILLVAMGVPSQELWLDRNQDRLRPAVRLAVGGLLDFYSGRIPRAPLWLREIGLEWGWRLWQEPGRMWQRYVIGNPLFLLRAWADARRDRTHSWAWTAQRSQRFGNLRFRLQQLRWLARRHLPAAAKRWVDVCASAGALALLVPFLPLVAMAIKLESRGPVFFQQTRVGQHGHCFSMIKFRSMHVDAESRMTDLAASNEMAGGVLFKLQQDPRVTAVGGWLRKTSIDELPQLFNVLRGEMSLVGPRPPLPSEVAEYAVKDRRRLEVNPGITCLWQISGRSLIPFARQVELDIEYIEKRSLGLDIGILARTIPAVLRRQGAF